MKSRLQIDPSSGEYFITVPYEVVEELEWDDDEPITWDISHGVVILESDLA